MIVRKKKLDFCQSLFSVNSLVPSVLSHSHICSCCAVAGCPNILSQCPSLCRIVKVPGSCPKCDCGPLVKGLLPVSYFKLFVSVLRLIFSGIRPKTRHIRGNTKLSNEGNFEIIRSLTVLCNIRKQYERRAHWFEFKARDSSKLSMLINTSLCFIQSQHIW